MRTENLLPRTAEELRAYLPKIAEESYREFSAKLIPGEKALLGVRLPVLRKLAKWIAQQDFRTFLTEVENTSFEETMIKGMVIGYAPMDVKETLQYTAAFVPEIRNWSICDSFCAGLMVARKAPERVWNFLQPYLASEKEFEARFGVVMLLDHYQRESDLLRALEKLEQCPAQGYYARMAVAWALSVYFAHFPAPVLEYLKHASFDPDTLHKTERKILESYRVDSAWKDLIRKGIHAPNQVNKPAER